MSAALSRARSLPGLGAYFLGLGLIVSATFLNLAHDRMSERDIASLPSFLPLLYEACGKMGMTLMLVTLGLSIMLVGLALQRPRRRGVPAASDAPAVPRTPIFYSSGDDAQAEASAGGSVVLQTRKYLAHANLSGTTGMPARRAPRG